MDLSGDLTFYLIGGLAFLFIAGLGIAFTGDANAEKASKRARQVTSGDPATRSGGRNDPNAARKKQTQQMLKKLREQDETRRKSLVANDIQSKINQAGLEMNAQVFWIISIILGAMAGFVTW